MAEPNRLAAALSYEQDRPAFGNPRMIEQGRKMRERKQAEQIELSAQRVKSDLLARALMRRYNPETLTGLTDTPGPQTLDEAAGLDPRVDRSTFLPYSQKEGLHVPAVVADVMKLATASNPQYSNLMQPEEAMPLATNMMGGGVVASRLAPAPAGSLGMNVAPKITKKTKEFFAEGDLPKPKENHVRIFRGSWQGEPKYIVEENPKNDVYGGVFGSSGLDVAKSHGNKELHYTDIPQDKILTHYDLNYEIPYEKTKAALLKAQPHLADDPELFDDVYKIVVEDASQDLRKVNEDLINRAFGPYGPEVENEVQRIRGQVSKNLGYQAVEMVDEHGGGTYLISPGAEFKTMENIPQIPSTFFVDKFRGRE